MNAVANVTQLRAAALPAITANAALAMLAALVLTLFVGVQLLEPTDKTPTDSLEITQLYCYPVKGLRGCALSQARLGKYGFVGDRTFALQKVHRNADDGAVERYETMLVGYYLQLALFQASIDWKGQPENPSGGEVIVTWQGRDTEFGSAVMGAGPTSPDEIRFPLFPSTKDRPTIKLILHSSPAQAHDMGNAVSLWFSERLGFEARLVHIGHGSRPVLGSLAPHSQGGLRRASLLSRLQSLIPLVALPAERLAFSDLAHYLVVTEESNAQVSSRLDGDLSMDVTKFRPNVVVKGARGPFVEDFWGQLTFQGGIAMPLTANCYRCQSITVDFATGKAAADDRGTIWKKLSKDRRVDKGARYSPVFGRYGFCFGTAVGGTLAVGQSARVTRVNGSRTTFDWPHLTTFGVNQAKK
ncbi:Mitochondrial amidoxime-reducing component 1 [Colletotrichum spinosum]|uniref:Mitochondrial amidoxime-reducing component 1 n=1 Tax=Colletotrichum spinosum TaxID=1347390 RepID=A0A4R8PVH1_9PEZI|nr:Mitochondrial amidoxime-reducing component 1 [Colletotrichum spinosum]